MVDFECTIEQIFIVIQLLKNEMDCLIWTESLPGKSVTVLCSKQCWIYCYHLINATNTNLKMGTLFRSL